MKNDLNITFKTGRDVEIKGDGTTRIVLSGWSTEIDLKEFARIIIFCEETNQCLYIDQSAKLF